MARRLKLLPPDRISITEADLLDALATASTAPEDARTVQQMAAEMGLSAWRVQSCLRALHAQGRLVMYKVPHVGIDGRRGKVPAYTIRPKAKG